MSPGLMVCGNCRCLRIEKLVAVNLMKSAVDQEALRHGYGLICRKFSPILLPLSFGRIRESKGETSLLLESINVSAVLRDWQW